MSRIHHFLEVEAIGVRSTVTLGGIPVFEQLDGAPRVLRRSVGAELVAGTNTFVAEIAYAPPPPPPPEGEPETPQMRVALYRVLEATTQMQSDLVAEATWTEELCALPPTGTIPLIRHRFGAHAVQGGTPWSSADVFRDDDRPAIVGFVIELHQALGERNAGRVLELMNGCTHGRAAADGVDGDAAAQDLALELELLFEDEAFEMRSIAPASLVIERLRDGRIASVRGATGEPAIVARMKRGLWSRTPIVSLTSGKVTMWS